jgi:hypothetical protein
LTPKEQQNLLLAYLMELEGFSTVDLYKNLFYALNYINYGVKA